MNFLVRSSLFVVRCSLIALIFAAGCESPAAKLSGGPGQVREQRSELQSKLEKCETENEQLKKQIETLSNLPGAKAGTVYELKAVTIGRYTNLFDEDKNGSRETLVVYIQPTDDTGDIIKAAGSVEIQLWDLNKPDNEALIGEWKVEPNELKKQWVDSIMASGYRITFDVSSKVEKFDKPLTVKISFVDYLSGRTFTEQKAIKP